MLPVVQSTKKVYLSAFSLLVKKVAQYISLVYYFIMTGSNKLYFYLKF